MTSSRTTNRSRNFFASRWFLISLLVGVTLVALGYARAYYQDYKIKQEIEALQSDIEKLDTKRLESLKILEYVMSDRFVEDQARTDFGLQKPGERVVVVAPVEKEENRIETRRPETRVDNIARWWYYFTAHALPAYLSEE